MRTAACLEEHFPHPVARAVVRRPSRKACTIRKNIPKSNMVARHCSPLHGKRAVWDVSYPPRRACRWTLCGRTSSVRPRGRSILYLAVDGKLAGLIAIEDPLRPEAAPVIRKLLGRGIRVVMLTGDDERTAAAVAERLGISEYRSQVLPTDKAEVIRSLQAEGHTVAMLGDGINDSPALSAADGGDPERRRGSGSGSCGRGADGMPP
ncbi:MAG: HAD-IC family P-type ATPase [Bilophila wadsworthia]